MEPYIFCFSSICLITPPNRNVEIGRKGSGISYTEKSINLAKIQIENYVNLTELKLDRDLNDNLYQITNNGIFAKFHPALNAVRDSVETAKKEGKDASHCYDTTFDSLQNKTQNIFRGKVVPCISTFGNLITDHLTKARSVSEDVLNLSNHFEKNLRNCHKTPESAKCSKESMANTKNELKRLSESVDTVMKDGEKYEIWLKDLQECLSKIEEVFEQTAKDVNEEATRCIETSEKFGEGK